MSIPFVSRHVPSAAQAATVQTRFGELIHVTPIVFEAGRIAEQLLQASQEPFGGQAHIAPAAFAVVAPAWAILEALREGLVIVEFENVPSARARGVFLCRGAWVHTLVSSEFIPCPIPETEQEESALR